MHIRFPKCPHKRKIYSNPFEILFSKLQPLIIRFSVFCNLLHSLNVKIWTNLILSGLAGNSYIC